MNFTGISILNLLVLAGIISSLILFVSGVQKFSEVVNGIPKDPGVFVRIAITAGLCLLAGQYILMLCLVAIIFFR